MYGCMFVRIYNKGPKGVFKLILLFAYLFTDFLYLLSIYLQKY